MRARARPPRNYVCHENIRGTDFVVMSTPKWIKLRVAFMILPQPKIKSVFSN